MPKVVLLFCLLFCLAGKAQTAVADKVGIARMEYIFALKHLLNGAIWPHFSDARYEVPLIYHTENHCLIASPTPKFLRLYRPFLVAQRGRLKIYKLPRLLDKKPFHMETGTELSPEDSAHYAYRSPYMHCNSFEITARTIPDVHYTEQWVTMIIHEYFHGFQFQHKPFLDYFSAHFAYFKGDSLQRFYKANAWFKESVDRENALLLTAVNAPSNENLKPLLDSFFALRIRRRAQFEDNLHYNIAPYEKAYETLEGTARYVEWRLYSLFAGKAPSTELHQIDTAYGSYTYFRNYTLEQDPWLYQTAKTSYYYAIGFNMARLLDKLGMNYKGRLFREGGLSLEAVLTECLEKGESLPAKW